MTRGALQYSHSRWCDTVRLPELSSIHAGTQICAKVVEETLPPERPQLAAEHCYEFECFVTDGWNVVNTARQVLRPVQLVKKLREQRTK